MTTNKLTRLKDQYGGKHDPKPLRGSGCASCGGARPPMAVKHGDPFCSATCARIYFEVKGVQ